MYLKDVPDSDERPDTVSHIVRTVAEGAKAGGEELQGPEDPLHLLSLVDKILLCVSEPSGVGAGDAGVTGAGELAGELPVEGDDGILLRHVEEGQHPQQEHQARHLRDTQRGGSQLVTYQAHCGAYGQAKQFFVNVAWHRHGGHGGGGEPDCQEGQEDTGGDGQLGEPRLRFALTHIFELQFILTR